MTWPQQPPGGHQPQSGWPQQPPGGAPHAAPLPAPAPATPKRPGTPLIVMGIVGIVVGLIALPVAGFVWIFPLALFIMGGGGSTDAFQPIADGFTAAALAIAIFGVLLVVAGIAMLIAGIARRRSSAAGPEGGRAAGN